MPADLCILGIIIIIIISIVIVIINVQLLLIFKVAITNVVSISVAGKATDDVSALRVIIIVR